MKIYLFLIIGLIIAIYGGANYYIGLRGWQAVGSRIPFVNAGLYWGLFAFIATSYLIARLVQKFIPDFIGNIFTLMGSYWMAAMLYFLILILIIDLARLINSWIGFMPKVFSQNSSAPVITGIIVLVLVIGALIYGTFNAMNAKVKHYDVFISKNAGEMNQLHAVMVSDLHLGNIVDRKRLDSMVAKINELNPDIVLIPGDIIDDDIKPFIKQDMMSSFKKLKPRFGVFASFGNHEYFGGSMEEKLTYFKEAGINILKDSSVKLENSFYLLGREDKSAERLSNFKRKDLIYLTKDLDKSLPLIVLDHTPTNLQEADEQRIDLQLSGHTHHGQFFPADLFTERLFEIDWGYLKKDYLQIIVSDGFGTWGPPIRIGNSPEIVDIKINFRD